MWHSVLWSVVKVFSHRLDLKISEIFSILTDTVILGMKTDLSDQGLDLTILADLFQLSIFCDSVIYEEQDILIFYIIQQKRLDPDHDSAIHIADSHEDYWEYFWIKNAIHGELEMEVMWGQEGKEEPKHAGDLMQILKPTDKVNSKASCGFSGPQMYT
ncbi:hypothetical protein TURU_107573 [Turdus rufiventris]|nr:hypothetical protein TURU_107573 [Turdus rufiventris]